MKKGSCTVITAYVAVFMAAVLVVGLTSAVAATSAPTTLKDLGQAFVDISKQVKPAVVNISSSKKIAASESPKDLEPFLKNHPFREFFGDEFFKRFKPGPFHGKGFRQRGMGSGVIVAPDGYILTNSHVVKGADEITVTLADKRSYKAKVKGVDPESDIAVIKIDAKNLPIAKMGDSDKLRVGEIVLAVGNPFGLDQTVTSGIVSAKGRTNVGIIDYEDFIQTDAAINPGNSGGPLVNIQGEVVGINTAIATRSGGYQGIGFAIPSNSAKLIMESLLTEGKVRRGLLGVNIQDLTESLAESFGKTEASGALVAQVIPGSPAQKAGVKSGDIILKFDGKKVSGAAQLKNMVGRVKPGTESTLTVFREKKKIPLNVKIGERDQKKLASLSQSMPTSETTNELGVAVGNVPEAVAEKLGLKAGEGVRIKDIESDSVARRMGLRAGDVIVEVGDKKISDLPSFNQAVTAAKKKGLIRLKVQRGKARIFLAAPMTKDKG
jgi:serine protease Do